MNEFEPLLLTRQTGGLTLVDQPLYTRALIPIQWQKTTMYTKMEAQHAEPGSDSKNNESRGLENNLAIAKHGKSGPIQEHLTSAMLSMSRHKLFGHWLTKPVRQIEVSGINFINLLLAARNTTSTSSPFADQRHGNGAAWQIINHIVGDDNKADPSKVRL